MISCLVRLVFLLHPFNRISEVFDIGVNGLYGTIPTEVGLCRRLGKSYIGCDGLPNVGSGLYCDGITHMSRLHTNRSYPFPYLSRLAHQENLYLERNNLSGSLPTMVGRLGELSEFLIANVGLRL